MVGLEAEPLGIVSLAEAMAKAEQLETDLVEIAPKAVPPVCRLMDYGKFKYAQSKKLHEAKLLQLNCEKARGELSWRPRWDFVQTMHQTIKWYKEFNKGSNTFASSSAQLQTYELSKHD